MLFYFSNVERQRTFSFSEFFCYDFLHHKNGGRTQFWARPVKFANTTVNFFPFLQFWPSQYWTSRTTQTFFVVFSQDTSLFCHRSRSCQAIQCWLNQDSPAVAILILFDCNLVALKRSIKLCKWNIQYEMIECHFFIPTLKTSKNII